MSEGAPAPGCCGGAADAPLNRRGAADAPRGHRGVADASLCIVIPTLDEERALPDLLARLSDASLDAADRADRVVVADGGSRDRTLELARAAGACVVEAERGRGAQLHAGAQACSDAELLLFLHADTIPGPGALAHVRRAFADGSLEVTAMRQRISARGRIYRAIESAADARARRFGLVWGDSGLGIRRATYERIGGFAPLPLFEDVELSLRLRRARVRVR